MSIPSVELNTRHMIPALGLGTWAMTEGAQVLQSVKDALALGYRLIDTAYIYKNETGIGQAVRESGIPRNDIFLISKVWNDHQYGDVVADAFGRSMERLALPYVDLYLIHHPIDPYITRTWRQLESFVEDGRARAIGTSNFMVHQLDMLLAGAKIRPAVNQIHFNPLRQQRQTVAFCKSEGIVLMAHSPFEQGKLLTDPRVLAIATAVSRTPAQVILRWIRHHGLIPIPKSATPARLAENLAIFDFDLPPSAIAALDAMDGVDA